MSDATSLVLLGLLLGVRHATDPDHVVAVTAIATRERTVRGALPIGFLWGVGHALTLFVVGGAIALFGIKVPSRIGLTAELGVAVMLVGLGAWSLVSLVAHRRLHAHAHPHVHADGPVMERIDRLASRYAWWRKARPIAMGVVHGLAGSAAAALLVLTVRTRVLAMTYLFVFGLGTIAGMLLVTSAVALSVSFAAEKHGGLHRLLGVAAAVVSVGFGCFLAYDIAIVHGLFSGAPDWQPH